MSRDLRSTLGAAIVVVLGVVFAFWFGANPPGPPVPTVEPAAARAPTAAEETPSAVGGGPRATVDEDNAKDEPTRADGVTEESFDLPTGVPEGPMDCYTGDGAPYVGTDC